jgi:hypothetical protein
MALARPLQVRADVMILEKFSFLEALLANQACGVAEVPLMRKLILALMEIRERDRRKVKK